jgi:hypothetical protein
MASGDQPSWPEMFKQATMDQVCNKLVSEASDPNVALLSIITQRSLTPGSPSDECLDWHCQVMKLANLDNHDLYKDGNVCTNTYNTKPPYFANFCVCFAMAAALTFSQAAQISDANACGPMAALLPTNVFQTTVQSRNTCLRESIYMVKDGFGATLPLTKKYETFSQNNQCIDWLQDSQNHHQWFKALGNFLETAAAGISAQTYSSCIFVMCQAYVYSMQYKSFANSSCFWNTQDDSGYKRDSAQDVQTQCNAVGANSLDTFNVDWMSVQLCNTTLRNPYPESETRPPPLPLCIQSMDGTSEIGCNPASWGDMTPDDFNSALNFCPGGVCLTDVTYDAMVTNPGGEVNTYCPIAQLFSHYRQAVDCELDLSTLSGTDPVPAMMTVPCKCGVPAGMTYEEASYLGKFCTCGIWAKSNVQRAARCQWRSSASRRIAFQLQRNL